MSKNKSVFKNTKQNYWLSTERTFLLIKTKNKQKKKNWTKIANKESMCKIL